MRSISWQHLAKKVVFLTNGKDLSEILPLRKAQGQNDDFSVILTNGKDPSEIPLNGSLSMSAMPLLFGQVLLNQGDKGFDLVGLECSRLGKADDPFLVQHHHVVTVVG